jgi:hypothetical protein
MDRILIWHDRRHNVKHALSTIPFVRGKLVEIRNKSGVEADLWLGGNRRK